jgi:hypothetical protein
LSKRLGHANIAVIMKRHLQVYREQDVAAAQAF